MNPSKASEYIGWIIGALLGFLLGYLLPGFGFAAALGMMLIFAFIGSAVGYAVWMVIRR